MKASGRQRIVIAAAGLALGLIGSFGYAYRETVWRRLWLPWPLPPQEVVAWTGNYAVDARSGTVLWGGGEKRWAEQSLRMGQRVVLVGERGELECRDVVEGVVIWRRAPSALEGDPDSVAIAIQRCVAGEVLVETIGGTVRAFDAKDGRELWSRASSDRAYWRGFLHADGLLLSTQSTLERRRLATGELVWEQPGGGRAVQIDAQRVAMTERDAVVCRRADSGDELWRVDLPGATGPLFAAGPCVVIGGRHGQTPWTVCLDSGDGKTRWWNTQATPAAAALAPDGRHVLVALGDGIAGSTSIAALDSATWTELWSRPLPAAGVKLHCEGMVAYVGTYHPISCDVSLQCIDVARGTTIWTADVRGIVVEHSRYRQQLHLLRREGWIAVVGCADAGDYVETFDIRGGEAIARWKSARGME